MVWPIKHHKYPPILLLRILILVLSYEFYNIIFCELLVIYEVISYYGAQSFSLHSPRASPHIHVITCSSPHRTSKVGDSLLPSGHLQLTLGDDFTTHGLLFMDATYQFIECSSHGFNLQKPFLTYQLILVSLHGSSLHPTAVYISNLVEHTILISKRKIPIDIMMERFTC